MIMTTVNLPLPFFQRYEFFQEVSEKTDRYHVSIILSDTHQRLDRVIELPPIKCHIRWLSTRLHFGIISLICLLIKRIDLVLRDICLTSGDLRKEHPIEMASARSTHTALNCLSHFVLLTRKHLVLDLAPRLRSTHLSLQDVVRYTSCPHRFPRPCLWIPLRRQCWRIAMSRRGRLQDLGLSPQHQRSAGCRLLSLREQHESRFVWRRSCARAL